ncbi:MAG: hypothetical protein KDK23_09750 [Leptospiraceae bacterium]|nr:hypothetical protein [Leptospiraceae bacterium]
MEKIESTLMQIARVIGVVMMSIVLVVIVIMGVAKFFSAIGDLFARDTPDVEFYKSDFVPAQEVGSLDETQTRPPEPGQKDLDAFFETLLEEYGKVVGKYAMDNEGGDVDRMVGNFEQLSRNHFAYSGDFSLSSDDEASEKRQAFLEGYLEYLEEAKESGIPILTQKNWEGKNVPVASLPQSQSYKVYSSEFRRQMKEIKGKEGADDLSGMLNSALYYMAIFGGVVTFLMIALMFSILRIENHLKRRN